MCRELSKTYEEVRRDTLADLAGWAGAEQVRGEITVLVAGADPSEATTDTSELAAWTTLCSIVLNLDETISKE